jgi:hypothetical protein
MKLFASLLLLLAAAIPVGFLMMRVEPAWSAVIAIVFLGWFVWLLARAFPRQRSKPPASEVGGKR